MKNDTKFAFIREALTKISKINLSNGNFLRNFISHTKNDTKFSVMGKGLDCSMRIGHGYDVHRLTAGRPLILGGVKIEYDFGLSGHSDADVLLHAVCDALLGAAALGDIGKHYPDNDENYKNIDSRILLRDTVSLLKQKGFNILNIDSTIIAQKPKLAPFIQEMCSNIAEDCGISEDCVNVKATTEEGLGFTGNLEGISAHAVCLIE